MANANHVALAATAKTLIEENGRTLTFTNLSTAPVDPAKPHRARVSSSDVAIDAIGAIVALEENRGDGATMEAYVAANVDAGDLSRFDRVTDLSRIYRIIKTDVIAPGDVTIVYRMYLAH